jgi:hypothetical protein
MSGSYGPSGALFVNDRKERDTHPDYEGYLELDRELVTLLVEQVKAGDVPKLDVKAWKKVGKSGKKFLSLSPKPPFKRGNTASGSSGRRGGDSGGFDEFDAPSSRGGKADPWG